MTLVKLNVAYATYVDAEDKPHSFLLYHSFEGLVDKPIKLHDFMVKHGMSLKEVHLEVGDVHMKISKREICNEILSRLSSGNRISCSF